MTDELSAMTSIKTDTKNLRILNIDPGLEPYRDHLEYRMRRFAEQKVLIDQYEGGIEEFSKGNITIFITHHVVEYQNVQGE